MRSKRRGGLGSLLHSAVDPDSKPCEVRSGLKLIHRMPSLSSPIVHPVLPPTLPQPPQFTAISDYHSKTARRNSSIMVFKGPGNVRRREYMKLHFV